MHEAGALARERKEELSAFHIAVAYATSANCMDLEAVLIRRIGSMKGRKESGPSVPWGRMRPKRSRALRLVVEQEASVGTLSIPRALLRLQQLGELIELERSMALEGGDLRRWLEQHV
ncbi:hypothetical protein EDF60_1777 [Leucobacter luti]|nr:hypothetical protein EDF60_1777 [Leucobacter luti]